MNQCRDVKAERRRTVALWSATLGPDSPETLLRKAARSRTLIALEERTESGAILAELLPRMDRVLGPDHLQTLVTRKCLADVHTLHRRYDEARALLTELRSHPTLRGA